MLQATNVYWKQDDPIWLKPQALLLIRVSLKVSPVYYCLKSTQTLGTDISLFEPIQKPLARKKKTFLEVVQLKGTNSKHTFYF